MSLLDLQPEVWHCVCSYLCNADLANVASICSHLHEGSEYVLERRMWAACWRKMLKLPYPENIADIVWYLCTQPDLHISSHLMDICLRVADSNLDMFARLIEFKKWNICNLKNLGHYSDFFPCAFLFACENGLLALATFLEERHVHDDPASQKMCKIFCLQKAAEHGHIEILQFLSKTMCAADARAHDNCALRDAARNGHVHVLKYLRNVFGLNAHDARADRNYALFSAASFGHAHVLQCLHDDFGLTADDARGSPDHDPLFHGACSGHVEVLQTLKNLFGLTAEDARVHDNRTLRRAFTRSDHEIIKCLKNDFHLTSSDAQEALAESMKTCWLHSVSYDILLNNFNYFLNVK